MVTKSTKRNHFRGGKNKAKALMLTAVTSCLLLSSLGVAAEDSYSMSTTRVTDSMVEMNSWLISTIPNGERTKSILLAEDEDSIVVEIDEVSNPYEEYRISLYRMENDPMYLFKHIGPINTSSFKITGLEGGNKYYLLVGTTSNAQTISGRIYAAKSGDESNDPKESNSIMLPKTKNDAGDDLTSDAMLLSAQSTIVQSFTDVAADSAIYESAEDLTKLGILSGYEDGTLRPNNNISRAEFAEIAAKVLPPIIMADIGSGWTVTADGNFVDLDNAYWASHSILRMSALRYINGYEDNTFRAENNITYNEAIKIIVEMLNYGEYARNKGGYPHGYIMQAMTLGITEGLSFDGNSPATRGDVILMIENMLDVPHLVVKEYDANFNGGVEYKQSSLTYRIMRENNYPGEGIS